LFEEKINEGSPLFIEPYGVRWPGVAQTPITMKIAPIQAVEEMPKAVRVRSISVSDEPEIKRIVKAQFVDRAFKKPTTVSILKIRMASTCRSAVRT
jgi:hypothetical protein